MLRKSPRSTKLNMAVVAAIPSASVSTTTALNPGLLRNCRRTYRMSWIRPFMNIPSLVPERHHGIDLRGAACWDETRCECDDAQGDRNCDESCGIAHRHPIDNARQCARSGERTHEPDGNSDQAHFHAFAHDQTLDATGLRPQSDAQSDFSRALCD